MTACNAATDLKTLRIGVTTPNLAYGLDWVPHSDHRDAVLPMENVDTKVSTFFDRVYLTHDLDVTCEIVGSYEENAETATLRYLAAQRLLFAPKKEPGYNSGQAFVNVVKRQWSATSASFIERRHTHSFRTHACSV